ncbi:DUF7555 family protein [Natronococcus occultus]|uniref:Uncharacterized protein n=1 Tax=Natronococcus occultus SP4 TaxID=694430 RepID=L0JWF2_9EURY|nr:hypothetical protein [Natronococcus occultus]AGB36429.1 hypothetical protein Natoc_0567 [Natronococcus occultus SP4]
MAARESAGRLRRWVRIWIDGLTYALAVTLCAGVASVVVGVATGGGLVRAKELLFLGGWLLLAYATFRLWPSSPEDVASERDVDGESIAGGRPSTRFRRFVRALPPARWVAMPHPKRRMTTATKLLLSGVSVLLLSLVMEVGFGI